MKTSAIIVDDEKMARTLLEGMLNLYCPEIEIVELCSDLPQAVKAIHKHKPQLVYLDIEMPGHSGLEIIDFFNPEEIDFSIIFTTAYNEYALDAFKLSAVDYLLKPIESEELERSFERFKRTKSKFSTEQMSSLKETLYSGVKKKIAVPTVSSIRLLQLSDIVFFKADGSYTEIYLLNGEKVISSKGLKHYEDVTSFSPSFFRCHKSYVVNLEAIDEFVKSEGGHLKMQNGMLVQFSSDKAQEILKRIS
jgi:two-component system, LytTR family, response regulator